MTPEAEPLLSSLFPSSPWLLWGEIWEASGSTLLSWVPSWLGKGLQPCANAPNAYFEVRRWRLCLSTFKVTRGKMSTQIQFYLGGRPCVPSWFASFPISNSLLKLASLWRVAHRLDLSIFWISLFGTLELDQWLPNFFDHCRIQRDGKPCDRLLYRYFPTFHFLCEHAHFKLSNIAKCCMAARLPSIIWI